MNSEIETLKDLSTEIVALRAVITVLIATHPEPDRARRLFRGLAENIKSSVQDHLFDEGLSLGLQRGTAAVGFADLEAHFEHWSRCFLEAPKRLKKGEQERH